MDIYLKSKNSYITTGKSLSTSSNGDLIENTFYNPLYKGRFLKTTSSFDKMVRPSLMDDVVYGWSLRGMIMNIIKMSILLTNGEYWQRLKLKITKTIYNVFLKNVKTKLKILSKKDNFAFKK